jgi:transglutaminase-like putative cysteine protease
MHFEIRHRTAYAFGAPVFLEPHILRFCPRSDPAQSVESFSLALDPVPSGISFGIDLSGNDFAVAWFEGTTTHLVIDVHAQVRTRRSNPFDYIILPEGLVPLPWSYRHSAAAPYLARRVVPDADRVAGLAQRIAKEQTSAVEFLGALNEELHRTVEVVVRDEGHPHEASETYETGVGSCRDLAVLFADACRSVGIPARFVSGYQAGDPDQDERYLHAWAEAWLPGAGWRGYDPTLGLVVADHHMPVAAAAEPGDAAPVTGDFRGSPPSVRLSFELEVREISYA